MPLLFGSEGVDGRPWEIDPQLRARCVRLVRELPRGFPSHLAAADAAAWQDGVPWGSVRRCPALDDVVGGTSPGVTSAGTAEVKRSKAENDQLCEDQETLRPASVLFAASSTRATSDPGVRRRDERRGLRGLPLPIGAGGVSGSQRRSVDLSLLPLLQMDVAEVSPSRSPVLAPPAGRRREGRGKPKLCRPGRPWVLACRLQAFSEGAER